MNSAVIVSRPNISLSYIREIAKMTLGRDLTTNVKGYLEPLATLGQLIHNDEYKYSTLVTQLLDYTFSIVIDSWTYDALMNCLFVHSLSSYGVQTVKDGVYLVFIKGTLAGFSSLIKNNSQSDTNRDMLDLMNRMLVALENEGIGRIFNDVVKEKQGDLFYLRVK